MAKNDLTERLRAMANTSGRGDQNLVYWQRMLVYESADCIEAAEKVIAAARSLLTDTPLGVPTARTLSQALVAWDGTDKEES